MLLGPSGCGKTTLLRIIAGLETETSGDQDRRAPGERPAAAVPQLLAMVFQNYAVFPHMTVFENIAFGLRMQKKADEAVVKRKVEWAAELMHIESQPQIHRPALGRAAAAGGSGTRACGRAAGAPDG